MCHYSKTSLLSINHCVKRFFLCLGWSETVSHTASVDLELEILLPQPLQRCNIHCPLVSSKGSSLHFFVSPSFLNTSSPTDSTPLTSEKVLRCVMSQFSSSRKEALDVLSPAAKGYRLPVCGLQQLLNYKFKGRRQAIGGRFFLIISYICSFISSFSQAGKSLECRDLRSVPREPHSRSLISP